MVAASPVPKTRPSRSRTRVSRTTAIEAQDLRLGAEQDCHRLADGQRRAGGVGASSLRAAATSAAAFFGGVCQTVRRCNAIFEPLRSLDQVKAHEHNDDSPRELGDSQAGRRLHGRDNGTKVR